MRPAPRIEDVPCESCQYGYGEPHVCEIPDYCPCDQWRDKHVTSPGKIVVPQEAFDALREPGPGNYRRDTAPGGQS